MFGKLDNLSPGLWAFWIIMFAVAVLLPRRAAQKGEFKNAPLVPANRKKCFYIFSVITLIAAIFSFFLSWGPTWISAETLVDPLDTLPEPLKFLWVLFLGAIAISDYLVSFLISSAIIVMASSKKKRVPSKANIKTCLWWGGYIALFCWITQKISLQIFWYDTHAGSSISLFLARLIIFLAVFVNSELYAVVTFLIVFQTDLRKRFGVALCASLFLAWF